MTARHRTDDAPVTTSECLSRWWCGWLKWGTMMGILALVWPAMGWIYVIADNARASTNDQNIKIEREIERTNAVKGDIADIKETIKDVNSELKAMRKEQAGFFRGIAK